MKPKLQWVVQPSDGATVREVLALMQAQGIATQGRVFVNGRPGAPDDETYPGDYLEVWPQRPTPEDGQVRVVAQRDGVMVVYKPAGMPTETTHLGQDSLVSTLLQRFSGAAVHAASRLDTQVSGLVTFTLGPDAARRLAQWRQQQRLWRSYIAIAPLVAPPQGQWRWPLSKRRDGAGRHHSRHDSAGGKRAITTYTRLAVAGDRACLLLLKPHTGRFHQLRAHAKLAGAPLFGDRLYGGTCEVGDDEGRVQLVSAVALHAIALELPALDCYAPPPQRMKQLWQQLGGAEVAWGRTDPRGSR